MISYSLYELEGKSSKGNRQGALLKVQFEESIGYADCFSWPELGDLPLKRQLELLSSDQLTPITQCALELAKSDAKARASCQSLNQVPKSHFLITDLLQATTIPNGFTHVKMKIGRQIEKEIEKLLTFQDSPLKLRLDFNETSTPKIFRQFLSRIEKLKDQIDFIEDPFAFHPKEWKAIQKEGWRLASDREAHLAKEHPESASVLILKPAIQSLQDWKMPQEIIVTSYLGHPIGQMAAAYAAAQIDPEGHFVHGLLSHHVYRPNSFSSQLNWDGPSFTIPSGYGWGFDEELQNLPWSPLK